MTTVIRSALLGLALVVLLGLGIWYYLFGANHVDAADLVPGDTVIFATIPNAAEVMKDYQTSHLKQLIDSPDSKPVQGLIAGWIGQKNLGLLQSFLPNLSGQSFIAVTHFDPNHWAKIGLIAGLKPKPGMGDFNAFVADLKAAYPLVLAQGKTGTGQVEGLDYQWIQGPGASDKICVAQYRGWIMTAWGEDALRDWWDRLQKKAASPSLAKNPDFQKSLERVGKNSEAILYIDYHALMGLIQNHMERTTPGAAGYLARKWQGVGPAAIGTRFEQGDIADHFSFLMPRQARIDAGMTSEPCAFETLNFTGPYTRFYWGSNCNWVQAWKNFQDQNAQTPPVNPMAQAWMGALQNWAQANNLDVQRNIIDALGNEISLQAEWSKETAYPEVGFFAKLAKPDDFKPTVAAIIETIRKKYETSAEVDELESNGRKFATLKFVQALPISPTITEDGPYFGLFLTANQAVRSFQREAQGGLLGNADFKRQIGDRRTGADQILFLDTPQLVDQAYQSVRPLLMMAQMFNPRWGSILQGQTLPADLKALAPMGTWSYVMSSDDEGFKGYSISGIGNQGIVLTAGLGGALGATRTLGLFPGFVPSWGYSAPASAPPAAPAPTAVSPGVTNSVSAPAVVPATSPSTNASPQNPAGSP